MRNILNRLKDLRTLSGNAQLSYLNGIKSDLLRDILDYTYNTKKKYKIDEGKFNKFYESKFGDNDFTEDTWKIFKYTILDHLADIKSAKDSDVQELCEYLYNFNEETQNFLKMVIFKDLRLGLNVKKIQKIWPDFCVTYPYMGCQSFKRERINKIVYPAYAQTKMDGSFCNVIVGENVEYFSRQSKPQKMEGTLDDEFLKMNLPEKYVFTGEALVWDEDRIKPLPRKIGNGILRREDKTDDEKDRIFFVCWDCLPYKNFVEKTYNVPYIERFEKLCHLFEQSNSDKLRTVNTWVVNNAQEAMDKFQEQYELGEEGVVIKAFNQIWVDGKPSGQVKIKAEKSCELRMIDFQEGKGMYSNMCGNIHCISEDNLLEVFVKPRTPKDAIELWNNQDKYKDKILEVKFNEVIYSETKDKPSLYLPVFVEIRDDKDIADTLEYIENLEV